MMRGEQEHRLDEYEKAAQVAIMHEAAHRAKKPKAKDLFERPSGDVEKEESLKEKIELTKHTEEWLSQWNFEKKGGD